MANSSASDWVEQATLYASLHQWSLIPLVPRREVAAGQTGMPPPEPRFEEWRAEYAADEPTIRSWGDVVDDAEIGLVTGAASGVIALEIRVEPGGRASLNDLAPEGERLPDTVCFSDYNRDAWLIFQHPGFPVASMEVGPGLSLHGEESIIRLPGSQYLRASGGLSWDGAPGLDTVAPLPGWFWRSVGIDMRAEASETQEGRPARDGISLPFERGLSAVSDDQGPAWIARPWAAAGSLCILLGTAKRAGKSTWIRHLARSVLSGEDFLERPTSSSPVIFLTEESRAVFRQALQRMGFEGHPSAENLHVLYHTDVHELSWKKIVDACLDQSYETGARLVLLDTLNCFTSERSIESMSVEAVEELERLTRAGLAVIAAVHHPAVTDGPAGDVIQKLGPIVSASDTVCHLRVLPRAARTHRRLDVWSRFQEAEGLYVAYTPRGYQPLRSSPAWAATVDGDGTASPQLELSERIQKQ